VKERESGERFFVRTCAIRARGRAAGSADTMQRLAEGRWANAKPRVARCGDGQVCRLLRQVRLGDQRSCPGCRRQALVAEPRAVGRRVIADLGRRTGLTGVEAEAAHEADDAL
jgi:hypothetical protein